jgi:hypothetical protein
MKRIAAVLSLLLSLAGVSSAQNWSLVTATNLTYQDGTKLPSGKLCFTGTDSDDNPVSFKVGGGGQAVSGAVCTAITDGAIGSFSVPNPAVTAPANINYRVEVNDNQGWKLVYTQVHFTGSPFNFDAYVPNVGNVQSGTSLDSLTVEDIIINGTCSGSGCPGVGGGSPVKVNNVQINNPNLNDTTPAAGTGYQNCKWNVSSSNIALECPNTLSTEKTSVTLASIPYTITSADFGKVVILNNPTAALVVLPNPASGNSGNFLWVENVGAGLITLTRAGGQTWTIDGTTSVPIYQFQSLMLVSDGTSWYSSRGKAGIGDPSMLSYLGPTISMAEFDQTECQDGEIHKKIAGVWACGTDTGGGSGGSVNINGVSVSSPNFNGATPAAQTGFINATLQNLSSSVSIEVPYGTNASSFSRGDHLHAGVYEPANNNIQAHIASTSNPHSVTKAQVGLGNADNTSDPNKPVSTAQQAALNLKADDAAVVHNTGDENVAGIKTMTNGFRTGSGIPNDTSTGTANKLLAKFTSTAKLVKIGTSDTAVPLYIIAAGGGTSGNAYTCTSGQCTCTFDAAATAQHYVVASSTTAGNCHDAGASLPTDVWVIGQVNATIGGAGDGVVNMLSGFVKSSGGSAGCTAGSPAKLDAGTAGACQYDATYFYFASSTNFWQRVAWDTSFTAPTVATPTHSPDTSTVNDSISGVTIATSTSGATLKYCLDNAGSCDPTTGTTYSTAVAVSPSGATVRHLRSIGQKAAMLDSAVKDSAYTFKVATPTCSPAASGGPYGSTQTVTCSSTTASSTTRCTVDGSTPTGSSPVCTSISVSSTLTLKAIGFKTDYVNSTEDDESYVISTGPTKVGQGGANSGCHAS